MQYRHGDVLLHPATFPNNCVSTQTDTLVLAEGEATGHCHTLLGDFEQTMHEGQLYLRVNEPSQLTHQEHATLTITPGEYCVLLQVEEWMDEVRQVID